MYYFSKEKNEALKAIGIDIPRVVGYIFMKNECPIDIRTQMEIDRDTIALASLRWLCFTRWGHGSKGQTKKSKFRRFTDQRDKTTHRRNTKTEQLFSKYIDYDSYGDASIQWDKIHGKRRHDLKFEIRRRMRLAKQNMLIFNKYVGNENILRVFTNIENRDWDLYKDNIVWKPWFMEKTYSCGTHSCCEIYVRIESIELIDNIFNKR